MEKFLKHIDLHIETGKGINLYLASAMDYGIYLIDDGYGHIDYSYSDNWNLDITDILKELDNQDFTIIDVSNEFKNFLKSEIEDGYYEQTEIEIMQKIIDWKYYEL